MNTIETKIIDNFLPEDVFHTFMNPLLSGEMPLHYLSITDSEQSQWLQFEHSFYAGHMASYAGVPMPSFDNVSPITWLIGDAMMEHIYPSRAFLFRAKLNVIPRTGTKMHEGFHVDFEYPDVRDPSIRRCPPHAVGLLYMNTTNGPTVFEDGEEIDCVENRLVIFDGLRPHTSSSCTDQKMRIALNTNYFIIEERVAE